MRDEKGESDDGDPQHPRQRLHASSQSNGDTICVTAVLGEASSRTMALKTNTQDTTVCSIKISPQQHLHAEDYTESRHSSVSASTRSCPSIELSVMLMMPPCMSDNDLAEHRDKCALEPPVTTTSLQELDLQFIKNNPSLRIDVNYDHKLHFTPITGCRGAEKRAEAHSYWQCIELELRIYQHGPHDRCELCVRCQAPDLTLLQQRIPTMLAELKALILLLVPDDEHSQINAVMDIDFLLQQIQHGVLDTPKLAQWLNTLLTNHCAPMRDEWADDMSDTIAEAALHNDMQLLTIGLEKLFSFLECMRLDVANHQIRTYRVPLIEDGVAFQIDYFEDRICQGRLCVEGSRKWFRDLCRTYIAADSRQQDSPPPIIKGRDVLVRGLISLCFDETAPFPITFKYDDARLRAMQEELTDATHLILCRTLFGLLYRHIITTISSSSTPASKSTKTPSLDTARIIPLLPHHPTSPSSTAWTSSLPEIAMEITRQAYLAAHLGCTSTTDMVFAATHKRMQEMVATEAETNANAKELARKLEDRVLHWTEVFGDMSALEVAECQRRFAESRNEGSGGGWCHGGSSGGDGRGEVGANASANGNEDGGDGDEGGFEGPAGRKMPDLEDVSRRVAHLVVVHWWVWRGLCYLDEEAVGLGVEAEGVVDVPAGASGGESGG